MEKEILPVIRSPLFDEDLADIYQYGIETFGQSAAEIFLTELSQSLFNLSYQYLAHPECRYLATRRRLYHNLIFGSYLIIYRIKPQRIEVLRAFHGSRSPAVIRSSRSVRL